MQQPCGFKIVKTIGMTDLRQRLITHILNMRKLDETYARSALKHYNAMAPWLDLNAGVRLALEATE